MQKPLLNVGIAMLCLAFSDASVRAEAEHTSLARWAVVSSLELQRGGIPDLVTAKLAGVDGLQLVERDRILEATRELTISRMAGAEGTKARLSLGRTVGADVLLLLIDQPIESKPGLLVVISDCRLGARLRSEHLMLPTDDAQPVVARIGELVDWTRRQFAGGIQFVVGVSPFVSQTLVHDWDYLQFSMARVLEGALASRPGVAAIEIEEARAIRSERDLTAGTGSDRLVPLLVEGTYRITPSHNGGEPTMSIQVKLEDGRKVLHTLDKDGLALSAAAEYVRTEAQKWSALAGGSGLGRRIGRDEQIAFMTQQAASFANLGAYDQSTALREACLLLSPELIDQRTALVREYSALIRTKPPWAIEARPMEAAEAAAFLERFVQHWGLFFQHADLLIRGPNGPPKQIPGICRELVSSMEHFWAVMDDQGMAIDAGLRQDCLNRISELKTRFIRTSLPLLLSRMNEQEWQDLVVRYATCSFVPRSLDWSLRDTHALVTLLLEAIPPAQPVYGNLAEWFVDKTNYWKCDEISCETQETDAMREVCRQLIASRQHRTVLLGRLIQLCLDRRIQKAKSDGILAASRDLEAEAREWGHPGVAQIAGGVRRDILVARGTPEPPPSNISYWAPDPPADFIPKTPVHLRAERIEMSVKDATGTIHPAEGVERWARGGGRTTLVRCDGSADALWNGERLFLESTPGLLVTLIASREIGISSVVWDGARLWVGTKHNGILLFSAQGEKLGTIESKHGLPPADHKMRLLPVAPGKVLAVGSFGERYRAWLATITTGVGGSQVNVFHEATEAESRRPSFEDRRPDDTQAAFIPDSVWRDPGAGNLVFISRRKPKWQETDIFRADDAFLPLQVDLRTLTVSRVEIEQYDSATNQHVFEDGSSCHVDPSGCELRAGDGRTFSNGERSLKLGENRSNTDGARTVVFDGWLYVPGHEWWLRINSKTLSPQLVVIDGFYDRSKAERGQSVQPELFKITGGMEVGASRFHGLMAWSENGAFCKLSVVDPQPPAPTLDELLASRPVPAEPRMARRLPASAPASRPSIASRDPLGLTTPAPPRAAPPAASHWRDVVFLAALILGAIALLGTVHRWREQALRTRWLRTAGGLALLGLAAASGRPWIDEWLVVAGLKAPPAVFVDDACVLDPVSPYAVKNLELPAEPDPLQAEVDKWLAKVSDVAQSQPAVDTALSKLEGVFARRECSRLLRSRTVASIERLASKRPLSRTELDWLIKWAGAGPVRCSYDPARNKLLLRGVTAVPPEPDHVHLLCHVTVDLVSVDQTAAERRCVDRYVRGPWFVEIDPGTRPREAMTLRMGVEWVSVDPGVSIASLTSAANDTSSAQRATSVEGARSIASGKQVHTLKRTDYRQMSTGTYYWSAAAWRSERDGRAQ